MTVAFYRADQGREPVREWLKELTAIDQKIVGDDLQTLEFGWSLGMPICRSISRHQGLWEVRSHLSSGRIARVLFCITAGRMILLHAFIKKTQKTLDHALNIATKRMTGKHDD